MVRREGGSLRLAERGALAEREGENWERYTEIRNDDDDDDDDV